MVELNAAILYLIRVRTQQARDSPAIDDELDLTIAQQTDLDWLMYNDMQMI